jgi:hypothetical protein
VRTLSALNKEQEKKPGEGKGVGRRGRREMADLPGPLPVCGERREERRGRERRRKAETLGGGARVMERYSHRQRQIQRESKLQVHGQWPAAPSSLSCSRHKRALILSSSQYTHTHIIQLLTLCSSCPPRLPISLKGLHCLGPARKPLCPPCSAQGCPCPKLCIRCFFSSLG